MHHQEVTGLDSEFLKRLRYCLPRMHRDISSKLQNTIPIEISLYYTYRDIALYYTYRDITLPLAA